MRGSGETPTKPPGTGLAGSLRRLLSTGIEIAQVRLELLLAEYEREKLLVFDSLVQTALALMLIGLGLLLALALLVLVTPADWRPMVLGLLTVGTLGGGTWLAWRVRHNLSSRDGALAATRAELAQDRNALQAPD